MKFKGGEFSTGTMGNFQPELTLTCNRSLPNVQLPLNDPVESRLVKNRFPRNQVAFYVVQYTASNSVSGHRF